MKKLFIVLAIATTAFASCNDESKTESTTETVAPATTEAAPTTVEVAPAATDAPTTTATTAH
jgi:uncharacterized lipoprotein YajG